MFTKRLFIFSLVSHIIQRPEEQRCSKSKPQLHPAGGRLFFFVCFFFLISSSFRPPPCWNINSVIDERFSPHVHSHVQENADLIIVYFSWSEVLSIRFFPNRQEDTPSKRFQHGHVGDVGVPRVWLTPGMSCVDWEMMQGCGLALTSV